jgi:hypothetical protein
LNCESCEFASTCFSDEDESHNMQIKILFLLSRVLGCEAAEKKNRQQHRNSDEHQILLEKYANDVENATNSCSHTPHSTRRFMTLQIFLILLFDLECHSFHPPTRQQHSTKSTVNFHHY